MQPPAHSQACTPDIVLVPLVAFDSRLVRLGQGAGHYDRALSLLDTAFSIGIAWSVQHAPSLIADPWDIPMDAILTERSWISL
ncbi:MAG: 5-formyltetrahydrofolate cyclo-ligase, partial [Sphingorhabdus sp.]